jgi:hypothetical protein
MTLLSLSDHRREPRRGGGCFASALAGILIALSTPAASRAADAASAVERPAGYLFAHMTREDYGRLYYAISTNGLHWTPLNNGRRVLPDYRGHPDITRGHDGRFYLLGNTPKDPGIRFWVSDDLVNWRHLRDYLPDPKTPPGFWGPGGFHGAPKMFFDEASRQYLLTWHSSRIAPTPKDTEAFWRGMRTLYVLSKDLGQFSEPRRLFGFDLATIDVLLRREGDRYFAILKDEKYPDETWPTGKTIRISSSENLLGPYSEPGPSISPNFREAPMVVPRPDGRGWYLYCEQYPGVSYTLLTAPSLGGAWHALFWKDYSVPASARHGCLLPLKLSELRVLQNAFAKP